MAYLVERPNGSWELRESITSARGPRSRTLATFRCLGEKDVDKAVSRSETGLTEAEVVDLARRAGAPVERTRAEAAAAELIEALARGEELPPPWREALLSALDRDPGDHIRGADRGDADLWINASLERRGQALEELLDFAEAIGAPGRAGSDLTFPGLDTVRS